MLARFASLCVRAVERWIPDPFVIAVILTLITGILAITLAGFPATGVVGAWGDGFWGLLRFTAQIILTFVLGHALAHTPLVSRLLERIANSVSSARGAYLLVCFTGGVAALLSWGLSLVTAAILARTTARNLARRNIPVHYPLLVASGYAGFVIWHMGLSGSIPLAINTPGHFLENRIGLIGVAETLFTSWNMGVALFLLVSLPFVMAAMAPKDIALIRSFRERTEPGAGTDTDAPAEASLHAPETPAAKLEQHWALNGIVAVFGLVYLILFFGDGGGLNLDIINFIFLMGGIALARSPQHYLALLTDACRIVGPFLLQYPFYAGVMGLMRESGLGEMVVNGFVSIANAETLPILSFLSAGLLNLFIPSGGGQWAIQGPIVTDAAMALGADIPRVAMAVAWGDQWTNMIQPLFAIPALAIAGLHIRDIMGYGVIALLFTGAVFLTALALF